jgi:hypothetical protein
MNYSRPNNVVVLFLLLLVLSIFFEYYNVDEALKNGVQALLLLAAFFTLFFIFKIKGKFESLVRILSMLVIGFFAYNVVMQLIIGP